MNEFWKRVLETCVVILGNCLYAFGVAMFIVPGGLITGGTTGIAAVCAPHDGLFRLRVCTAVQYGYVSDRICGIQGKNLQQTHWSAPSAIR